MSKKSKNKSGKKKITPPASTEPASTSQGKNRKKTKSKSKLSVAKTLDVEEQQQMPKSDDFDSKTPGLPVSDSQIEDDVTNSELLDSSLPPYDPVTNYLSPRPKFLRYNPDKHREILDRQQDLIRNLVADLSDDDDDDDDDDEMPHLEDIDHSVVKTEEIVVESVVNSEEYEDEDEEEEFEDDFDNGWSLNVFVQYLVVMVALIWMTLAISSMNSPPILSVESITGYNVSETYGPNFGPMMLMGEYLDYREIDKGYKKRDQNEELAEMSHEQADEMQQEIYFDEKVYTEWKEPVILASKKIETYRVLAQNEVYSQANEESEILKPVYFDENVSIELQEPVILVSEKIETTYRVEDENDVYKHTQLLGVEDHNSSYASEESEILKQVYFNENASIGREEPVNVVSKKIGTYRVEDENDVYSQLLGVEDHNSSSANEAESENLKPMVNESVTKVAYFGPLFAAFSAIFVLIFASTGVMYYTMHTEVAFPNEVFDESSSVGSFGSRSSIISEYYESNKDACSSNQTTYFDFQKSTGESTSHGSFTVEKKIVRKQKSKTPEAIISTVRRSSRIHIRSISSP